jgi:hypothetical protein
MITIPFIPKYTLGQTVAPTTTAASVTLGVGSKSLCLTNLGSVLIYVRASSSGAAATAADYPVPVGSQVTIGKFQDDSVLSYVSESGTGSLHIIQGEGF